MKGDANALSVETDLQIRTWEDETSISVTLALSVWWIKAVFTDPDTTDCFHSYLQEVPLERENLYNRIWIWHGWAGGAIT